jgi:PAS domain S-box-containing protein
MLAWIFVLVIVPMIVISVNVYYQGKNMLTSQIYAGLNTVSYGLKTKIFLLLESKKNRTIDFSSDGFIRESLRNINSMPEDMRKGSAAVSWLNRHLIKNKAPLDRDIHDILVIDGSGIIVSSTDEKLINSAPPPSSYRKDKDSLSFISISRIAGQRLFGFSAPLTDINTGRPIGSIILRFRATVIDSLLMAESERLDKTQILISDNGKTVISASSGDMLGKALTIAPAINSLEKGTETTGEFNDLSGTPSIGSSLTLDEYGWAVVVYAPKKAVFSPVNKLAFKAFVLIGIGIVVVIALTIALTRDIAEPISSIAEVARKVAAGDWKERVKTKGRKDEIEQLASAFNGMICTLHNSFKALRDSENRIQAILNTAVDGIITIDEKGIVQSFNQAAEHMFGYNAEEVIGRNVNMLMPSPYHEEHDAYIFNYLKTGHKKIIGKGREAVAKRKDGTVFPVDLAVSEVYPEGGIRFFTGMIRDISKRKKAEKELERLASIPESNPNPIIEADIKGAITYLNPAAGLHFPDIREKGFGHPVLDSLLYMAEEAKKSERQAVSREIAHNGRIYEQKVSYVGKGDLIRVFFSDLTERRKLEEQLRQSQKMEAIGQLAGGVAHDFNNILTAIIGYGGILNIKMPDDDPLKANVSQILAAAERAANLTQGLLAFSRRQIANPQPVNLNDIVTSVQRLLMRLIGEDIELKTILSPKRITVVADHVQMDQILINLVTNARDAMPRGGILTISTQLASLDADFIKAHGYGEPGQYALLSVSDTGIGMDEHTRQRIFEPFFTTKEQGKGTGLGLSIVYGIVKQHNGYINVYSEPEKGTTFRIYLPASISEEEERGAVEHTHPKGGTETILIAEDDNDVRQITANLLAEFGYKVIEAADGEEAISRFVSNKNAVGVVLLDVIMPKKNGKEAYEEMKKAMPDLKALFMSGYTEDIIQKKGLLDEGMNFISKPASPFLILRKVRELLDA